VRCGVPQLPGSLGHVGGQSVDSSARTATSFEPPSDRRAQIGSALFDHHVELERLE
jgi:hypothetical protein